MDQTFLIEFGVILIVAAGLGILAKLLKQPLVLAYLVAGVLIGPFAFGLVKNTSVIESFASIGTVFLLFLIGLELNPRKLLEFGGSALTVAGAQILVAGVVYYFVAGAFGIHGAGAFYLAAALTFSSTAIIVTLLSARNDLDSLHGKVLVGVLLIQDFVAIILLSMFSGLHSSIENLGGSQVVLQIGGRAILLFAIAYLVGQYIMPLAFHRIARNQEVLFISSLAWCFLLAIAALVLGFSAEIGAFLAGISLAQLPYSSHIASRTRPLRDFFIMIFFIYLGTRLIFTDIVKVIYPAITFSALILVVNPLIVMSAMLLLGYRKRTAFLAGITLTQVSEFSFIVVVMGTKLGILPQQITTLVSVVAIITVFISTYLISNSNSIYQLLRPALAFVDFGKSKNFLYHMNQPPKDHVILVGCHRIGQNVLETLRENKQPVVVIEFDPKTVKELTDQSISCVFGDAIDHDIIEHLNVGKANMLISTINKFEENELIIRQYKKINPRLKIILTADSTDEALDLYNIGADLVIVPTFLSGDFLSFVLKKIDGGNIDFKEIREKEIYAIKNHEQDGFIKKFASDEIKNS
jgi:Kef-type K+ transport system membrane component KefB